MAGVVGVLLDERARGRDTGHRPPGGMQVVRPAEGFRDAMAERRGRLGETEHGGVDRLCCHTVSGGRVQGRRGTRRRMDRFVQQVDRKGLLRTPDEGVGDQPAEQQPGRVHHPRVGGHVLAQHPRDQQLRPPRVVAKREPEQHAWIRPGAAGPQAHAEARDGRAGHHRSRCRH